MDEAPPNFGEYRFSEDLVFTGVGSAPTGRRMKMAMDEACAIAVKLLDPYAPVEIVCERHVERDPHPGGQESFDIRARFPWHRQLQTSVMVEIAMDEKLLKSHPYRAVLHDYGEPFETQVQVYSLEEVIAEKLRAILQHARALEDRGWVRSRARDYYDLWRILDTYRDQLDVEDFPTFLAEKCAVRDVSFSGPESFFQETMLAEVEKTWKQWLGPLVPELPPCKVVIEGLRSQVATLL